jgi:hypothetical protein
MDIKRSIRASNYTFARPSVAYKQDGTQVAANVPRFEDGKFGKAVMVEEGTTNYLNGASDIASPHGGTVVTKPEVVSPCGDVVIEWTAGRNDDYTSFKGAVSCSAGEKVTVSIWARKISSSAHCEFYFSHDGTYHNSVFYPTLEWQRYSFTVTCTGATTVNTRLDNNIQGDIVQFSGWQLEKKPYPTSFTPGTRSPETLTIPTAGVLNPQEGTVECWVYVNDASKYANRYSTIFIADAGGSGKGIWLFHDIESAYWRYQIKNENGNQKFIQVPDSEITNGWHHFAITWSTLEAKLFIDGVLKGTMSAPYLPSSIQRVDVGNWAGAHQLNSLIDDLRISSRARSDAEILANYQSGKPVGFDSYTTYYEPFDGLYDWQVVGVVFENPHTVSLQVKIEPSKTKIGDQYIDSLGLWDTITLPMLERPDIELAPPECNKVTVYTDTIEKSATVPGTSSDRIVEIRVEAPEGSSEAYCQQMADAILAAKSKERLSITCKVPLVTSLRFGELVPVILPYIGATIDTPYLAHVQRMEHHILENPPYTILSLGDFLPDDIEALVRLLKEG